MVLTLWHNTVLYVCNNSPRHSVTRALLSRYAPGRVSCLPALSFPHSRICAACLTLNPGQFLSRIISTYNYNFIGRENHGTNLRENCRVRAEGEMRDLFFCTMISIIQVSLISFLCPYHCVRCGQMPLTEKTKCALSIR